MERWLNLNDIELQEMESIESFENFYGKSQNGFSDFYLNGVELLLQGKMYLKDNDDVSSGFKDFNQAFRYLSYYHYSRVSFTFKAAYILTSRSYLSEAGILVRNIFETFARLRYIDIEKNIDQVYQVLTGFKKWNEKKFSISYHDIFERLSPGSYFTYQILCDNAHGAMLANKFRFKYQDGKIIDDLGIVFKDYESTFITNQLAVYLLGHLNFLLKVFPEISLKMPTTYKNKYNLTIKKLSQLSNELRNSKNQDWFSKMEPIINC
jgi:hypothetical protein